MLLLLAVAAVARPRHRFQSGMRDRLLARLTHAECTLPDSSQGFVDRPNEMSIRLMYADLKLRFRIGAGPIHEVAF